MVVLVDFARSDLGFHAVRAGRFLSGGGDIFGAGPLQQLLCPGDFVGSVTMHRQQDTTVLNSAFVAFGLVLRDTHAD